MDGIQAWVALPKEHEEIEPAFFHHAAAELPAWREGGASLRLIAGEAGGRRSPVRTHSPLFYIHAELAPGARFSLPDEFSERAAYVAAGSAEADGQSFAAGRMLVFTKESKVKVTAPERATLMLLGGETVGERYIEWNFVSSSRGRIEQAKADWRAGRIKLPDLDNREFIPLPGDPAPPPNPMS